MAAKRNAQAHRSRVAFAAILLALAAQTAAAATTAILLPESSHPAVRSAAQLIAKKLALNAEAIQTTLAQTPQPGQLLLTVLPLTDPQQKLLGDIKSIRHDGYVIAFHNGGALICGARPRSLLYAAGDLHLWKDKTDGVFLREPSFAIRSVENYSTLPTPEYVAELGLNLLIDRKAQTAISVKETLPDVFAQLAEQDRQRLDRAAQTRRQSPNLLQQACREADVDYYAFLYGNDFQRWSGPLYEAALKACPAAKGVPAEKSFEKASLCPSDPFTWKLIDAYLKEYIAQTRADGLYITFWDDYGLYCQCDRCKASGMNTFRNQLYACVQQYHKTLDAMGKKLIVRTWSSGVPHWLRQEWVHAPGYDPFGGTGRDLWGRVIDELPHTILLQTKVYHADCQPDPPFSELLGNAKPHTEIAEYQMTGQTTGRYYFPASTVNHTVWTMKKARDLVGPDGGVNLFLGGTRQTGYNLLNDILNSINCYAWRQLSWNVDADMDKVWTDWAESIYDKQAAPHMVKALQLSEDAVNKMFSTLGMGSSTNSDFAGTIYRREMLLMYTNRHYRPEFVRFLEPTRENIQRVIDEKEDVLGKIDRMFVAFEKGRPYLTAAQAREIQTRFDWLREFAIVTRYLEEALFRYRCLRGLNALRTTDPEQIKYIAVAYDKIRQHRPTLFRFDPDQQFRCYETPLGDLRTRPALGNPIPLIKEIYEQSNILVEEIVGPNYGSSGK